MSVVPGGGGGGGGGGGPAPSSCDDLELRPRILEETETETETAAAAAAAKQQQVIEETPVAVILEHQEASQDRNCTTNSTSTATTPSTSLHSPNEDANDGTGTGKGGASASSSTTTPVPVPAAATTEEAMTPRPSWDYGNRKVVLQNVHRYDNAQKIRKAIEQWTHQLRTSQSLDVQIDKVKKPPKDNWATITLQQESMVQPFIEYINNHIQPKIKNGTTIVAKRQSEVQGSEAAAPADSSMSTEAKHPQHRDNKRRERDDDNDNGNNDRGDQSRAEKRQRMVNEARKTPATEEEIKDAIIPLWRHTPDEQVSLKIKELIKGCALKVVKETKARFHALSRDKNRKSHVQPYKWLTVPCPIRLADMIRVPSPVRNKSEFTFGYRYEGAELEPDANNDDQQREQPQPSQPRPIPSLGVCAKGWAGGVSRPHGCPNIPLEACAIVDLVEGFLQTSPLPPYDTFHHTGIWRTLTVRTSRRTRECLVIIVHSPASGGVGERDTPDDKSSGSPYAESFESEKQRLVALLTAAELPLPDQDGSLKITSIFFQEFDGVSHPSPEHPVQHVHGTTYLTERLGDCSFQISPGAFFQVNTEGAELLYAQVIDRVREVVKDPTKTLLFDVCCGTGTIGISCLQAGVVGRVVGVDISEPAIRDAERNAALNGFSGPASAESHDSNPTSSSAPTTPTPASPVRFIAARAEEVLGREISQAKGSGFAFVAVVDPAREGLHPDVCKTLRSNGSIRRIVYVSCNPTGTLVRDAALLCAPPTKRYSGQPFRVTSATPVDMFPMTNHCELVMTFDRLDETDRTSSSDAT